MSRTNQAAFACYLIVAAFLLGHAAVYLTRTEFMPFHADAAGVNWSEVAPGMQSLLLALIRATGGGSLAVGVAIAAMLWFAFRGGERWAFWAIPITATIQIGILLWVSYALAQSTSGEPPWRLVAGLLALVATGAVLSALRT